MRINLRFRVGQAVCGVRPDARRRKRQLIRLTSACRSPAERWEVVGETATKFVREWVRRKTLDGDRRAGPGRPVDHLVEWSGRRTGADPLDRPDGRPLLSLIQRQHHRRIRCPTSGAKLGSES